MGEDGGGEYGRLEHFCYYLQGDRTAVAVAVVRATCHHHQGSGEARQIDQQSGSKNAASKREIEQRDTKRRVTRNTQTGRIFHVEATAALQNGDTSTHCCVYEAFQQCPLLAERVKLAEELNRYVPAERLMIEAPEYKGASNLRSIYRMMYLKRLQNRHKSWANKRQKSRTVVHKRVKHNLHQVTELFNNLNIAACQSRLRASGPPHL